jgi:hypothetical protein
MIGYQLTMTALFGYALVNQVKHLRTIWFTKASPFVFGCLVACAAFCVVLITWTWTLQLCS